MRFSREVGQMRPAKEISRVSTEMPVSLKNARRMGNSEKVASAGASSISVQMMVDVLVVTGSPAEGQDAPQDCERLDPGPIESGRSISHPLAEWEADRACVEQGRQMVARVTKSVFGGGWT